MAPIVSAVRVSDSSRVLFVHANTVAYRLQRVRDLTGCDPRVPVQAALLVLALKVKGDL